MSTMTYKGQVAHIEYDEVHDKFIGRFRVGKDQVEFEGKTLHLLAQALETTVNDYFRKTKIIHVDFNSSYTWYLRR